MLVEIEWYDPKKGYGFVIADSERLIQDFNLTSSTEGAHSQVFFHRSCFAKEISESSLLRGCLVDCTFIQDPKRGNRVETMHGVSHSSYSVNSITSYAEDERKHVEIIMKQQSALFTSLQHKIRYELDIANSLDIILSSCRKYGHIREFSRISVFDMIQFISRYCCKSSSVLNIFYDELVVFFHSLLDITLDLSMLQRKSVLTILQQLDEIKDSFREEVSLSNQIAVSSIDVDNVIKNRTSQFILILDGVRDVSNRSAIYRTVEALGIQHVWNVLPERFAFSKKSQIDCVSKKSHQWLSIRNFTCPQDCTDALRQEGRKIVVTELHNPKSLDLSSNSIEFPDKFAIVMGSEIHGISSTMRDNADISVFLPLNGFTESLNVTVATALIVQRLFQICPNARGTLTSEESRELSVKWKRR